MPRDDSRAGHDSRTIKSLQTHPIQQRTDRSIKADEYTWDSLEFTDCSPCFPPIEAPTMSLFRTLQNSPGVISIFTDARPVSSKVYQTLNKSYEKLNSDKDKFLLEVAENKMPTYDQYQSLVANDKNKLVLDKCYPILHDRPLDISETLKQAGVQYSTIRGWGPTIFNEGEYSMIYEAFEALDKEKIRLEIFKAPLVVDWDHNVVANDVEGLQTILKQYED